MSSIRMPLTTRYFNAYIHALYVPLRALRARYTRRLYGGQKLKDILAADTMKAFEVSILNYYPMIDSRVAVVRLWLSSYSWLQLEAARVYSVGVEGPQIDTKQLQNVARSLEISVQFT